MSAPHSGDATQEVDWRPRFGFFVTSHGARADIAEERLGGKFRRVKIGRANDALTAEKARKPVQSSSAAWPAGAIRSPKKTQAKGAGGRAWDLASLERSIPVYERKWIST
jgi:hypothetical protein